LPSLLQSAENLPTCAEALFKAPGGRAVFCEGWEKKEQYLFKSQQ
jgi:hypothetical protein